MDEFKVFVEQCFNQEPLKNIWEEYHVLLWHVTVILCSLIAYKLHNNKRYIIIDHQNAAFSALQWMFLPPPSLLWGILIL